MKEKAELLKCTNFPVILRVKTENGGRHAIIVTKITKRKAVIYDPHLGKYKMKISELIQMWDCTGLFVSEKKKVPFTHESFEPISKGKKFVAFMLQLFSGIALAFGIYFIKPDGPFITSIICLSIAVLFEILFRLYLYKLMSHIDDYFENKYDSVPTDRYFDYYVRSQNFKKNYLSSGLNIMYSVLVSTFLIFVTIFNNPLNFPLVVTAIFVAAVEQLVFRRLEDRTSQRLADEEASLKSKLTRDEMIMKVKNLQKNAYRFSRSILFKKYVGIFLCFVVAVLVENLLNAFTITNVMFALCIEIFLYQTLFPIFSIEKCQENDIVDKAKLSNIFYEQPRVDEKNSK